MVNWRKKIVNTFVSNYFSSAPKRSDERDCLRIRSSLFFPNFEAANPKEKEAYLTAVESLERKGVARLTWEKGERGNRLKTIRCEDFKRLFREAGKPYPQEEVDKTRALLGEKAEVLKASLAAMEKKVSFAKMQEQIEKVIGLFEYLSLHFSVREVGLGITYQTMENLAKFCEFVCDPIQMEKVTIRALSILLYPDQDARYLENLPAYYTPLLSRMQKIIPVPDLSFLERAFPETMIAGKIVFEYKEPAPRLLNAKGLIMILPLESVEEIGSIQLMSDKEEKTVLTIENKESFYALGNPQKYGHSGGNLEQYDCFLYIGGYPNRATTIMIKLLAAAGFNFHHAGDLDPDGVLILQHVQDITEKPVTPVKMDVDTFNRHRPWARILSSSMVRHADKIREDTKTIPGVAELLQRIEDTGTGIEQEVIDYR